MHTTLNEVAQSCKYKPGDPTPQIRQGDIMLSQIADIPETDGLDYYSVDGAVEPGAIILAYGEQSGHKHAIYDSSKAILVKIKDSDGVENPFFLIVKETVALQHGIGPNSTKRDHEEIILTPGNYQVIRQREQSKWGPRRVAD